jgi:peptidoglycan L-alanyl-D-glutamate endopeptidase CwlK
MTFALSKRSIDRLEGVNPKLIEVVNTAIKLTRIDFGVTEGLRTVNRQRELVAAGASQTMNSKHITGNAVDVVAYIGDRISWELNLYDDIADAFKLAAIEVGVPITWGGAWQLKDIREWDGTMQDAIDEYITLRRSQGKRPFIDGPHFELAM